MSASECPREASDGDCRWLEWAPEERRREWTSRVQELEKWASEVRERAEKWESAAWERAEKWASEARERAEKLASQERERAEKLSDLGFEVYFDGAEWVVDIHHGRYLQPGFFATFDSKLRLVNKIQNSLLDLLLNPGIGDLTLRFICASDTSPPEEPPRPPRPPRLSYAVVVSAVVLLSFVYQYLTGNVDRGGSKAHSRSSLDFRDIYVAIVLFLGAYVWIKFREVAPKGVYSRKLTDQGGRITKVVYEPRFKPPRENGRVFERIYLGQYATPEEASILYRIAAFYYNEDQGSLLDLQDGRRFAIPPMDEGERSLTGLEKRAWVKVQVMKVYEDLKKEKAEADKLLQELLEAFEDEMPQEQDEGFAVSNGHSLGSQEGPPIPVSHSLTPNTGNVSSSDELNLLRTLVRTQQELVTYQQQQISRQQQQLQDCMAQISELKQQHYLQQLLQDINEGVPSDEVEMEQSMHLQNHLSLMTLPCAGAEAQEAFI